MISVLLQISLGPILSRCLIWKIGILRLDVLMKLKGKKFQQLIIPYVIRMFTWLGIIYHILGEKDATGLMEGISG